MSRKSLRQEAIYPPSKHTHVAATEPIDLDLRLARQFGANSPHKRKDYEVVQR
jgi:hypothetical protein